MKLDPENKIQHKNQISNLKLRKQPKGSMKKVTITALSKKTKSKFTYFPLPMKSSLEMVLLFQTITFNSLRPSINVKTNFS